MRSKVARGRARVRGAKARPTRACEVSDEPVQDICFAKRIRCGVGGSVECLVSRFVLAGGLENRDGWRARVRLSWARRCLAESGRPSPKKTRRRSSSSRWLWSCRRGGVGTRRLGKCCQCESVASSNVANGQLIIGTGYWQHWQHFDSTPGSMMPLSCPL